MGFARDATIAYQARQARDDERQAESNREHLLECLKRTLDLEIPPGAIDAGPKGATITIDGVKLTSGGYPSLRVVGNCPRCGQECESTDCPEIADIGREIASFTPAYFHICPVLAAEGDTPTRLIKAFREFIAEEMEGR